MSTPSTPLSGVNQPLKGIALLILATLLFSSHDTLSKYLSGFYPIIMVVWVRYVVHTLLMACISCRRRACACCGPSVPACKPCERAAC